ncbi:hypothetical protein RPE78_14875 (plasmid) [Thioclava litoralis]|uniref:Uncharacterized protein n=1 Tax=Thioclava litoralis TaxID=3076557 RepID=A0ABZ1E221_9RHOB|nr:hypothetical protein RPE78_14875 [Thioclava sp. FTW29]
MSEHPDAWIILRVTIIQRGEPVEELRVLAGWFGGYMKSDRWRINSGIVNVEADEHEYRFRGHSGFVYVCQRNAYGLSSIMKSGLRLTERLPQFRSIELLEDQDWTAIQL